MQGMVAWKMRRNQVKYGRKTWCVMRAASRISIYSYKYNIYLATSFGQRLDEYDMLRPLLVGISLQHCIGATSMGKNKNMQ